MNILFIIGNGFDINLGINTKYTDFYKHYGTIDSKTELVKNLKDDISRGITNWADLELRLGEYTENIETLEEFKELYYDIADNLGDFLEQEEKKLDISKVNIERFSECLCYPEIALQPEEIDEVSLFKNQFKNENWNVDIVTLNYTRTIENILQGNFKSLKIGNHHNLSINLRGIEHIHGFTDLRMIMGVNDNSQIKNKKFHNNVEIVETLIKSNCNKVQRHNVDKICAKQIAKATVICIFGSSIGDSDNDWWNLIGEQLKKGIKLIIYSKGEEIKPRFGHLKAPLQRSIKNLFLSKTNLTEEEKLTVAENIYIGVNSKIFDII
jgi:hypothetical protein